VYDAETELLETKFQTLDLIFPNRICKGKKPKPTTQPPEKANSTSILKVATPVPLGKLILIRFSSVVYLPAHT
jgi:hypothetical protein